MTSVTASRIDWTAGDAVKDAVARCGAGQGGADGRREPRPPSLRRRKQRLRSLVKAADNLKEIKGVGPQLEKLLHDNGVTSFAQIAVWAMATSTISPK